MGLFCGEEVGCCLFVGGSEMGLDLGEGLDLVVVVLVLRVRLALGTGMDILNF